MKIFKIPFFRGKKNKAIEMPNKVFDQNVEIGKFHIKKYLEKFMDNKHIYSKKIGFHAPTTKFIYENISQLFDDIQYSRVSQFLDMDKTKSFLSEKIKDTNNREDYFLYSILYLVNTTL